MGQKVNPHGFRVGPTLIKGWDSVLYAEKDYSVLLMQDLEIRKIISRKFSLAYPSRILIERVSNKNVTVTIHAKKPGIIIGKSGAGIENLKKEITKITSKEVYINLHEVKKSHLDAVVVSQTVSEQLKKRGSFRKAMKMAIQSSLKQGAEGIKIACSGRLGGAEIARTEWYREGRVPLHTLRAMVSYGLSEVVTTYGVIAVKVWIYTGDKVGKGVSVNRVR
jgi:small subunit ribosomal protein S3